MDLIKFRDNILIFNFFIKRKAVKANQTTQLSAGKTQSHPQKRKMRSNGEGAEARIFILQKMKCFPKAGKTLVKYKKKTSRETCFLRDYLEVCTPQKNIGRKCFPRGFTHRKLLPKYYNPA